MNRKLHVTQVTCYLFLSFVLTGCGDSAREATAVPAVAPTAAEPADIEQETATEIRQAKAAIGTFANALKSELMSAMKQGGALNAIQVCNTRAILIGQKVSDNQELQLSRVSLKNRNPGNAPLDWQEPVLESFNELRKAGGDPNELDWSEMVSIDGHRQFRYMKAIPTGGLCLQCHGQNIAPDVSQELSALYPQDRATGYLEGQIRGAFVVVKDL